MRIDILCKPESNSRCERTLENVRQALEELGIEAEVHLFRDRRKMIDYRVYVSPALLIDDSVRIAGRVPEVEEITRLIIERPRYRKRMQEVA
jgi:small redox-active disulfide protein 2